MPLVPIGLGWLTGIWTTFTFALPASLFLVALLVPFAGLLLWRTEPRLRLAWLAALAAPLGGLRAAALQPVFDANDLATYNDQGTVTLTGLVDDYPDRRDTFTNLRLRADTLTPAGTAESIPIEGVALVRADRLTDYRYGDRLEVTGALHTPPEFATFNYADYLAGKGVYSIVDRPRIDRLARDRGSPILAWLFDLKDRARTTIAAILPEPQAALLTGILLGDDTGLPQSVKDDFRVTGTSHIIAISGYNFAVLIALASTVTVRVFGRRRAFPILLILVFGYALLVGWSASVVRAAIMGALTLWATYLGRQGAALNSLFAAAIVMTFLDPFTLGDVGFQLSFAATLGLVLYARPLQNATERGLTWLLARWLGGKPASGGGSASGDASNMAGKIVGVLGDAVLVTLAAQITTLPLLIVTFRQVSFLTLLVNALVLPVQTGVMWFGGLALLAGSIWLPLGQVAGWAAWLFLTWTIQVIHLFAQVPGVSLDLGYVDPLWGVAYVIVLALVTVWLSRPPEQRMNLKALISRVSLRLVLAAAGMIALLGVIAFAWRPDGRLHIHVLNVDGGPVFVQTSSGRQIVIGGSNSPSALLAALGNRMPFWDRDLDLMVVPNAGEHSLNGLLAVADRYRIGQIASVTIGDSRAEREWLDVVTAKDIPVIQLETGDWRLEIDTGMTLSLDANGWVRIDAGPTSVGLGQSDGAARVDILVLSGVSAETAAWLQALQSSTVVAREPIEPPEGVAVIDAHQAAVELVFDGTQWTVNTTP